ncbi:MAG: hypothetical protein MI723_02090 [Caulobacterales bacterium]|nr:hypothetical protein [Caulobacterales bacterium]
MSGDGAALIAWMLALPLLGGVGVLALARMPNLREAVTLVTSVVLFIVVVQLVRLVAGVTDGNYPEWELARVAPGLAITFRVEPLGALFAVVASGLWIINSLFSIGYMRGNKEKDQTRFFFLFTLAIASALAIAAAADLFTLFVFYEVLTLSTYPLVAHKGDANARRGARIYLTLLLSTSLGFFLPAILGTAAVAGTVAFTPGGLFPADVSPAIAGVLLVLFAFGIGKAALMPFHSWLPNAMVAPTPVSALLHAVAVVKAGVFAMLKVSVYVFGPELMQGLPAAKWLALLAGIAIVLASIIAMTKDNLKARLAFSTVSQLAYVTLGAMIATPAALMGGALQILMHAFGKITLFMCAGAIYTGAKKTEISDMTGLARHMPWTFAAFMIGAASVIGLPPLAGAWPKLALMSGSADAGRPLLIGALVVSSVLNVAYLLPIAARGFFLAPPADAPPPKGAPLLAVLPPVLTAFGCFALFFFAGDVERFLAPALFPGGAP